MSDLSWSVMITSAGFVVDAFGQSGSQLTAGSDDIVSWNNQTADTHQPFLTDSDYKPTGPALCDEIPPWKSSTPGYVIPTVDPTPGGEYGTLYYYCQKHPENIAERGTILVTS